MLSVTNTQTIFQKASTRHEFETNAKVAKLQTCS